MCYVYKHIHTHVHSQTHTYMHTLCICVYVYACCLSRHECLRGVFVCVYVQSIGQAVRANLMVFKHAHTYTHTQTHSPSHTQTHTLSISLFLSLSLPNTPHPPSPLPLPPPPLPPLSQWHPLEGLDGEVLAGDAGIPASVRLRIAYSGGSAASGDGEREGGKEGGWESGRVGGWEGEGGRYLGAVSP